MVIIVTVVAMVLFILIAGMMCRTRGGQDCSSVEDDKDNILDLSTKKKSSRSSLGLVIYAVSESTMEQLHISNTGNPPRPSTVIGNDFRHPADFPVDANLRCSENGFVKICNDYEIESESPLLIYDSQSIGEWPECS